MEILQSDVAVVGGGLAGVCAALAAAEEGCNVILIGDRPVLGGNSSSEIRVWTRGATGAGNLYAEEMGILGRLKMRNLFTNPDGNVVLWDEVLLEAVLEHKNITLLLNTHITDANTSGNGVITEVRGFQLLTEKQFSIRAHMYIDATGDGTVGNLSGAVMKVGKESDEIHNVSESEKSTKGVQGNTIFYYIEKTDHPVKFIPPSYVHNIDYIKKLIGNGGRVVNEEMSGSDYWWFEYGGMMDTIADSQDIALELKRIALGVWNYIKNSREFDADNLTLKWIGNVPGKRESRRLCGAYMLTGEDILSGTCFDDGVCYGGWYMDSHPAEGIFSKDANCKQIPVFPYQIPLRSLYSLEVSNLMFAGRDISTSDDAFVSSRVMNTCALTGQSAGTASAVCAIQKCYPSMLSQEKVHEIQLHLLRKDMFIPGLEVCDEKDIAKQADVIASSKAVAEAKEEKEFIPVIDELFVVAAIPAKVSMLYLKAEADADTELRIQCFTSPLPSRLVNGKLLGEQKICMKKYGPTWVNISIPEDARGKFLTLRFQENDSVRIACAAHKKTGFLMGKRASSDYQTPCFYMEEEGHLYAGDNIINGYARPYCQPNVWAADESDAQPTIELHWKEEVTFHQINLYFNPELSMEIPSSRTEKWDEHHYFTKRDGMPIQLVKAFDIYAMTQGEWKLLTSEEENWKRLYEAETGCITTKAVRIVVRETYGAPAEIFQLSVF